MIDHTKSVGAIVELWQDMQLVKTPRCSKVSSVVLENAVESLKQRRQVAEARGDAGVIVSGAELVDLQGAAHQGLGLG
jgi:hypothetical protein